MKIFMIGSVQARAGGPDQHDRQRLLHRLQKVRLSGGKKLAPIAGRADTPAPEPEQVANNNETIINDTKGIS